MLKQAVALAALATVASADGSLRGLAPQTDQATSTFKAAKVEERRAQLNAIIDIRPGSPPCSAASIGLLAEGLADSDAGVRITSLTVLGGCVTKPSFLGNGARPNVGPSPFESLRPQVTSLLGDADPTVRSKAVQALFAFDEASFGPDGHPNLSSETTRVLADLYGREPDPRVRLAIVHTFAFGIYAANQKDKEIADGTVSRALQDVNASVVSVAARGVGRRKIDSAVPAIVDLLRNGDREVRLQAAQSLGAFGDTIKPYIARVQAAAVAEDDTSTRRILESLVSRLARER